MFDEVTKREGGRRAAHRAGYVFGSTAFQIALVVGIIALSARISKAVTDEPVVDVKFVKPAAPPPPRPPPPPAPPAAKKRPPTEKPPANLPPPPPPTALLQPKEVKEEMKVDPNEPKEPEYDYGDQGSGEGVVGGVVGASQIEDAPQFATSGFVKPAEVVKNCVRNTVRIPPSLAGFVSGPVTVKFAVGRDGAVSMFQVMTDVPEGIAKALWAAIQSCKFTPGTDPRGKPTKIWVLMPVRFTQ